MKERAAPASRRFEIRERLGAGGMGVVYRAWDRALGAEVALKTLNAASADSVLRFKREFRSLEGLAHPNLVRLGELVEEDGRWYLSMELIRGTDFISWVRPGWTGEAPATANVTMDLRAPGGGKIPAAPATPGMEFDEDRLRAALVQLARGLEALHAVGRIHRDIKPPNVLVDGNGRVVLVDFGLVQEQEVGDLTDHGHVVGTAAYMAPEQCAGLKLGPESDWYSVGVVLYQAMTGRLPFTGELRDVMALKQRADPLPPGQLGRVPRDLDALTMALLSREGRVRPGGAEVLMRLGASPEAPVQERPAEPPFVGRERELALLDAAARQARAGQPAVVLVSGESGVGKSALVRRFADMLVVRQPETLLLWGRCFERASVPYKAIDGVIDALGSHLARLPGPQASAVLPRDAALLGQSFPALDRVAAVRETPRGRHDILDAHELRARLFGALRELFGRMARRAPLVVVIDDLHWADADSLALLCELLRPPGAPPLLLVGTLRPPERGRAQVATVLEEAGVRVSELGLVGLPTSDAEALATQLLGGNPRAARAIAREAGGHPLFIGALALEAARGHQRAPQLDDVIWSRVGRQDAELGELLEVIAVARTPIAQRVAARAAGLEPAELARRLARLRQDDLVRTSGTRPTDRVETYHDRVRAAVMARLGPDRQRVHHAALASALEELGGADAETLAVHWLGAGDGARGLGYLERAADQAAEALAFDRAAALYQRAIDLAPEGSRYWRRLGDALANAGRGPQAAGAYLKGAAGADTEAALDFQRRAAEELLRSGHLEDGLRVLGEVLGRLGLALPATPGRALAALARTRAQLVFRSRSFRAREVPLPPLDLLGIDVAWSAAGGLAIADPVRAAYLYSRSQLAALRSGDPYRVGRALAMECCYLAMAGGSRRRIATLLGRAREIAERIDSPHVRGLAEGVEGAVEFLSGHWQTCLDFSANADRIFRERCTGVTWERHTLEVYSLGALAYLGDFSELARRVDHGLREAEERGDLYATVTLRSSLCNLAWLARDQTELARRHATESVRAMGELGFGFQHYAHLTAMSNIDLYVGDGAAAHERLTSRWRALEGSHLMRIQVVRLEMLELRARTALARAATTRGSAQGKLVQAALRDAARMVRERAPWSLPLAELLHAGAAWLRGSAPEAADHVHRAEAGFTAAGMAMWAAVARRRGAELVGNAAGVAESEHWMTSHGAVAPARLTAMMTPWPR